MVAVTHDPAALLRIVDVDLSFGGTRVLHGVSFDVRPSEILALIGPNGAGKSSLLNVLTGVYKPQHGRVDLALPEGGTRSLLETASHRLVHAGVVRTFQNLQLVPHLTALENVLIGRHGKMRSGVVGAMMRPPRSRREERTHRQACVETLEFLGLGDVMHREVGKLPYGVNKRIELARALVTKPRLLLLDEPAAGLNDEESEAMAAVMRLIRNEGSCAQVLVEHDMGMVMSTADRLVVLNFGEILTTGTPEEIRRHPDVMAAYLGTALAEESTPGESRI